MKFRVFNPSHDCRDYFIVTYELKATNSLREVAWAIATGQSFGNPSVRSVWETEQLYEDHSCVILHDEADLQNKRVGTVRIAFPVANLDVRTDGISQMLVHFMGGQLDIDIIEECKITDIFVPGHVQKQFLGPKFGVSGIKRYTNVPSDKPVLGSIVKPKVGINSDTLVDIVKALVDGGVNFIKEDEIMSNPACCRLEERLPKVMRYLDGKNVIYAACITSDYPHVVDRAKFVAENGGNAIHVNFWNGMGVYKTLRELDLPLFLFFQKSGDKILTDNRHHFMIDWSVICKLAGMMGVDFIHAGMWGGYSTYGEAELKNIIYTLHQHDVMPSLSCGMHPGLTQAVVKRFGADLMLNVGGAVHGHPLGTLSGVKAMRQSIDGTGGKEYDLAIKKWGLVK